MIEIIESTTAEDRKEIKEYLLKNGYENTYGGYSKNFPIGRRLKGRKVNIDGEEMFITDVVIYAKFVLNAITTQSIRGSTEICVATLFKYSNLGWTYGLKDIPKEFHDVLLKICNMIKPLGGLFHITTGTSLDTELATKEEVYSLTKALPGIARKAEAMLANSVKKKGRM